MFNGNYKFIIKSQYYMLNFLISLLGLYFGTQLNKQRLFAQRSSPNTTIWSLIKKQFTGVNGSNTGKSNNYAGSFRLLHLTSTTLLKTNSCMFDQSLLFIACNIIIHVAGIYLNQLTDVVVFF